jgi:hypothetical protein
VSPVFFDPHVCDPPATFGRETYAEWVCRCGRRWYLSWFPVKDRMVGPSWILQISG